MKVPLSLILAALVCGALVVAGCTTAPASPASPAPASLSVPATHAPAATLSSLVLVRTDLPEGYVMTMNREKNETEVGSMAKNLGWQAGYVAEYTGTKDVPDTFQYVIRQSLVTYPEGSMPGIIESINQTDHSYRDLRYNDFPVTGLGENARGFTGTVQAGPGQIPLAADTGVLPGMGTGSGSSSQDTLGQSMAEIIFSKGTTLEIIRITGPGPGPEDVLAIARKAYEKIP